VAELSRSQSFSRAVTCGGNDLMALFDSEEDDDEDDDEDDVEDEGLVASSLLFCPSVLISVSIDGEKDEDEGGEESRRVEPVGEVAVNEAGPLRVVPPFVMEPPGVVVDDVDEEEVVVLVVVLVEVDVLLLVVVVIIVVSSKPFVVGGPCDVALLRARVFTSSLVTTPSPPDTRGPASSSGDFPPPSGVKETT
jgi:hypothetical protein